MKLKLTFNLLPDLIIQIGDYKLKFELELQSSCKCYKYKSKLVVVLDKSFSA